MTDYKRKADQHWELAGLARQDGDKADEERHTKLARRYDALVAEPPPASKRIQMGKEMLEKYPLLGDDE